MPRKIVGLLAVLTLVFSGIVIATRLDQNRREQVAIDQDIEATQRANYAIDLTQKRLRAAKETSKNIERMVQEMNTRPK